MKLPIGKLIVLLVVSLLGIGLGLYQNYRTSFREVTVHVPDGLALTIHKDLGGDGPFHYDTNGKPLFSLSSTEKISIKTGVYDIVFDDPSETFVNPVIRTTVNYGTTDIKVKPVFNDATLQTLLADARPGALGALYRKYPLIEQNYIVKADRLFELGDWYGVALSPKDPTHDNMRVILSKNGGKWSLAVDRPMVSIGQPSHPNIPVTVLEGTDAL